MYLVLDEHIHHTMMMSVTKSSGPSTGDCLTSGEGLHADTGSGCQVRLHRVVSCDAKLINCTICKEAAWDDARGYCPIQ